MNEIKREYAYRCTDDEVYTGVHGKEEAQVHQIGIDMDATLKDIIDNSYRVFNIRNTDESEQEFMTLINRAFTWCGNFNDTISKLVSLHAVLPEMTKFFNYVESKTKK